jgi:formylglycine-generating enzyme required for sulfatase activity
MNGQGKKGGAVFKRVSFVLVLTSGLAAGCAKNQPASVAVDLQSFPVIQPRSGGEMILLPEGDFTMGDSAGRPDEAPSHSVHVRAFCLDKVPVTQELYQKVMGVNPSKRKDPKAPVERMQWTDAARFCNQCSESEGLKPCYDLKTWQCDFEADGYRLPTEAEWEYACRAGSQTKYCCGDDPATLTDLAWFKPHSFGKTHPVGQKRPNRWGLYDMNGNVWQWCNDYYGETYYQNSPSDNPRGPTGSKMRVLRGGAWSSTAEQCRAAYRHKDFPVYSDACFGADSYGFRRARNGKPGKTAVVASGPKSTVPEPEKKTSPKAEPVQGTGKIDPTRLKGTILFVSDRGGVLKIWSMHASGKNAKPLTQGKEPDADPRFSPDGTRVTYTALRGGFPEVWMMARDGSASKFVTKGSQASWAPDGKSLIFIRDNQTFIRELDSGREKRVTPASWERCGVPAFSPDGKHFAVASRHQQNVGIYILGLDGKEHRPLKTEEACCTPVWSRDGKKMLCQTVKGHIHQVDADGKNWEQLTFGADMQHDARWSPDGTMLLFCRAPFADGPWQICVKMLDGDDNDFMQLTKQGSNLQPDWHEKE